MAIQRTSTPAIISAGFVEKNAATGKGDDRGDGCGGGDGGGGGGDGGDGGDGGSDCGDDGGAEPVTVNPNPA